MSDRAKTALITTAFVVVSLAAIFFGVRNVFHSRETNSWPFVPGRVVSSEVVQTRCGGKNAFEPRVQYEYEINEAIYRSNRISFDASCYGNREAASRATKELWVGVKVAVYYSPDDPSRSVLVAGAGEATGWIVAGFGVVFLVIGIGYSALSSRRRTPEKLAGS